MTEQSALELSDEEFGKLPDPEDPVEEESTGAAEEDDTPPVEPETPDREETAPDTEEPDTIEPGNTDETPAAPEASDTFTDDATTKEEQPAPTPDKAPDTEADTDPEKVDADKPDELQTMTPEQYASAYAEALAPLPANGKQIQIRSITDLRKLASKGANYTKKMVALKPNLKLMKMLENNGLLDEVKLSRLIDLDKKDPGAVRQLVKDSGIDPLEIDTEKDTEYTPNTYPVDDEQLQLDLVLDDIRDTPSYNETLDIIGNKWDESSKQILLKNPSIITAINGHVESGIYKKIADVVEHERMLGNLAGLSDLDAYKQIGDAIQAQGGFDNGTPPAAKKVAIPPAKKAEDDPKLKEKKRAASSTKAGKSGSKKDDFNPLAMSDEDFEKATANSFL